MFDKFDDCSMEKKSVSIECRTIFANSNTHLYFGITCSRYYIFLVIISIFGFTKHHLYRLQTLPIKSRIIDSVRFGKNLVYFEFFTVVIFSTKKSNFFSSQHSRKLTNCYRSLSLIQMEKTNTTNKVGDKHPGTMCST